MANKMLFDNPSDCYTFEADDSKIAMAAVLLLGEGQYGLRDQTGQDYPTLILCGGKDCFDEIVREHFGGDFNSFIETHRKEIAAAFDSVLCMDFAARSDYQDAIEEIATEDGRQRYRDKVHDRHRSSMNDIGKRAWLMAEYIRKKAQEEAVGATSH